MKKFLLLFTLALLASISFAAVANYTFGYTAGTYTEITDGTVLGTAVVDGTAATALDNVLYTATPLPFYFGFNGRQYNQVAVNSNGYLIFGGSTSFTEATPISATTVGDGCAAALGKDNTGIVTAGSLAEIQYKTLDAYPNRVFVIQWKNFRHYGETGAIYNFQIRLYESTNLIKYVYDSMTMTATSRNCQVGLRGTSNADYFNRTSTTSWAASTAGAINTATLTLSQTVYPPSGGTYTFTPDTATTYPNLATPVYPGNGASNIATSTNLSWADGGGWTESFILYAGTTNGDINPPWDLVNGVDQGYTTSYDPPEDLDANTTYYWKIVPNNSIGDNPNAVVWSFMTSGPPLSGIKTIGGTSPDYATLADAIAALNNGGGAVGPGGVTFNVRANHTESVTAPLVINATGTSGNEIIFQKDPATSGANPLITRTDAGSNLTSSLGGMGDAIIRIDGADFVTFNGIDVTASQAGIEYGYMTNKPNALNGCQNVTIKNSVVTMTKGTSAYVIGIYISNGPTSLSSNSGVTVTAASGINQYVVLAGNTIQNVHTGVYVRGYGSSYPDSDITVGQAGLPNIIQNYGGGSATTTYGIYFYYVNNPTVAYTTINNAGGGGSAHGSTLYGIYNYYAYGVVVDDHNLITLSNTSTSASNWIYTTAGTPVPSSQTYSNNTFAAGSFGATSSSYFIYASDATPNKTISGNVTSGTINKTGASGTFYVYYNLGSPAGGTETFTNNNFSNITVAGTSPIYGLYANTAAAQAHVSTGNTLTNWTSGTGVIYTLYLLAGSPNQISGNTIHDISSGGIVYGIGYSGAIASVYNNTVYNLSTSGSNAIYGIYQSGGTTSSCNNNLIYNVSGTNAGSLVYGIYVSGGGVTNVYNNMIYGLSAPGSATTLAASIMGIRIAGGTTNNIHYNSCLLNYNGANAYFSTAGLYLSGGTTNEIRNNIFVNKCVSGPSGKSAAVWSTATTAPFYIGANSNKNVYYSGLIANINAVSYSTLEDYKTFLADREQGSYYEDVPFQSSSRVVNLHIDSTVPTRVEGNAITLYPDFDSDYDNQNRNDTTPDIGADEGDFTVPVGAPGNVTLVNPSEDATSINPFDYLASWTAPITGAPVAYYVLYVASSAATIFDEYSMDPIDGTPVPTSFNLADVPELTMGYQENWYWAVQAFNATGEGSDVEAPDFQIFRFTTAGQLMAPDTLPLGNALASYNKKGIITVDNIGDGELTFTATSSPEIVMGTYRYSIPAQSSVELPYTFNTPATPGPYTGLITLTETSPGSSSVEIAVTATITDNTIIGTETTEFPLPVDPFYRYSYSQSIFYPNEIGWSNDYRIEKIYYYFNGFETCEQTKDFVVYMGHTTNSIFTSTTDWVPLANLTQVYAQTNEPQQAAGGYWMEFTLDLPFIYNCTDNLVIGVAENFYGTTYDATGNFFYGTASLGINRSIRYTNDTTIANPAAPPTGTLVAGYPNIKFDLAVVPTLPQTTVTPTTWDFGNIIIDNSGTKQFSITNTGGGATPLTINNITVPAGYFSLTSLPTFPVNLTSGQSTNFTVQYLPTAAGTHNETITIDDNLIDATVAVNGFCVDPRITSLPYTENFDGVTVPALPLGWTTVISSTSTSAYAKTTTTTPQSAPNNIGYYNSSDTGATLILVSPQVTVGISNIKMSFWARYSSYVSNLIIGTMSDPANAATFVPFATISDLTTTNAQRNVSFALYGGADQYIAFKMTSASTYAYIYLDTILMEQLMPNDMAATSIAGIPISVVGNQMSFNVSVLNNGTAAQSSYNIHLKKVGGARLATVPVTTPIAPGGTAVYTITWTPGIADAGIFDVVGEVELTGDGNSTNNETAPMELYIYPTGSFIPQIGDITSSLNDYKLPLNVYYKNSVSETIYLPQEMQMTSGTLTAIIYQNNFTQDITKPIKIWMKNTTTSDLVTSWLPYEDYTLVFEGSVHFPLGVNAVVIPLDTPFAYTGDNLAVRVYRVWEDQYSNNTNKFYYTNTPETPNRARCGYTDGTAALDPSTPDVFGNQATLSYLANTAFVAYPAVPVASLATPVVTAIVNGTSVNLTWPAITNAYGYRIYGSNDPYNVALDTPIATVHTNSYAFVIGTNMFKFFKVVAISTYRDTVQGDVFHPAAAKGIDNSKIKAEPLIPQTANKK